MRTFFIGNVHPTRPSTVFIVKAHSAHLAYNRIVKGDYPYFDERHLNHLYATDDALKAHDFKQAISTHLVKFVELEREKDARIYQRGDNWYFIGRKFSGSHPNLYTLLMIAKSRGEKAK